MEHEPDQGLTRIPDENDLVKLARELNRLGVSYVVIGGFAINRLGLVRATDDLDLLIALMPPIRPWSKRPSRSCRTRRCGNWPPKISPVGWWCG